MGNRHGSTIVPVETRGDGDGQFVLIPKSPPLPFPQLVSTVSSIMSILVAIGTLVWVSSALATQVEDHIGRTDIHQTPEQKTHLIEQVIRAEMGDDIAKLSESVNALRMVVDRLTSKVDTLPPKSLTDDVTDLKIEVRALCDTVANMERRIRRLEDTPPGG